MSDMTPSGPTDSEPMPAADARTWTAKRVAFQVVGIGAFYVLILAYFTLVAPHFASYSNLLNVLDNASAIGIVAVGQTLAIIAGGFDLSVAGVVPLTGVAYAMMVNAGVPLPVALIACIAIGALVGAINGVIIVRVGINPLITTLGTLSITAGLAYTLSDGVTIPFDDMSDGILAERAIGGISNFALVFLALVVVAFLVLRFTVFGRMLYAVGGNAEASRLAGIRVQLLTTTVYVICACTAALAGVVLASQLLAGSGTVGSQIALVSIAAVILGGASLTGGRGGVGGTVIGVLVLGTIANGMALMQVQAFYQQIATGAVLLFAVGFDQLRGRLLEDRG